MNIGNLYLVSTPIGNIADFSIRAIKVIETCDILICEEYKEAAFILAQLNFKKELIALNEHNELYEVENIISLLIEGKNAALISDCGTPSFSDPGVLLIKRCQELNIRTEFISGANSVLAALTLCGFDISRFYFMGFLSPKADIRKKQLREIKYLQKSVVIMDTPYRLLQLLEDLKFILNDREIFVGTDLTTKMEKQFRGTPSEIIEQIKSLFPDIKFKAEYIIIIDKPNQ